MGQEQPQLNQRSPSFSCWTHHSDAWAIRPSRFRSHLSRYQERKFDGKITPEQPLSTYYFYFYFIGSTVKVLITAPKNLILIFSWRFYWSQKILLKSLVPLKLGWRLVSRTLHTKAQCFLFSKRRFKKFSTAVGAINRAQQSSLTSKWRLN